MFLNDDGEEDPDEDRTEQTRLPDDQDDQDGLGGGAMKAESTKPIWPAINTGKTT